MKYTEKIGGIKLTYEAETIEDIVNLRNAINPQVLYAKADADEFQGAWKEVMNKHEGLLRITLQPKYDRDAGRLPNCP